MGTDVLIFVCSVICALALDQRYNSTIVAALRNAGRTAGAQTDTALPEHDCANRRKDEEQDVRLIDGGWSPIQQEAAPR